MIKELPFQDKHVLITGGTGSLGKVLSRRILSGKEGIPKRLIIFSRDEAKQHFLRLQYEREYNNPTDEIIYNNFKKVLQFRIGDVRDFHSIASALNGVDIVINAAALKQVPSCEYFPYEAVRTNIEGPENIIRAITEFSLPVEVVIGVSTDKACKPVNVMGMTKAIQEKIFIAGNIRAPKTRFVCVRYGNVLASRGSVIPLFHEQILKGGPLTITTEDMTRFLLPLERAVDIVVAAIKFAKPGETLVPRVPSATMVDVAKALIGKREISLKVTGIRPGEKIDEIMISDEEAPRTYELEQWYAIQPMLPELIDASFKPEYPLHKEYSSSDLIMSLQETIDYLDKYQLHVGQVHLENGELLR